jgi:hypothetical protein
MNPQFLFNALNALAAPSTVAQREVPRATGRLQRLFGRSFQLEVRGEIGEGNMGTMRIPLRKRSKVGLESRRAITSHLCELASN